jgi:hypothetical protein
VEKVSEKVRAFQARFAEANAADREDDARDAPTPEIRLIRALELQALNLALEIELAQNHLGTSDPRAVMEEVNRRRREEAPMPPSLRERLREIREGRAR